MSEAYSMHVGDEKCVKKFGSWAEGKRTLGRSR